MCTNCHNETQGTKRSCHGLTLCLEDKKNRVMLNRSLIIIEFCLSSEPRGYKNGKGVRASASKELCKGPERRRELLIGQGRRDAAENKEASNDEGWGRKDG